MNKEEAKNLVVKTFEQSFDESRFLFFIKNLLNELDESKSQVWAGNYIPESFRGAIKSYKRLGQYTDKNKNVIDILIVNVKRDNTLERARTLQRNFIARHLKQRNHEAALVAFYTEDSEDWRFSLVIMELNLTKTKVEIELSPAKRYSFLVGVNERSHTAQNQFVNLLSDKKDKHTLNEIEEAFNIETVTKEFFLEYRDLFIRTKKSLDKILSVDPKVKDEFEKKGVDSVNFSKKLLGQIVFLYFLQKKGWFGVERDDQWGEGTKKFLRELLQGKHGKFDNFFNDILEPLFYEALRIDRSYDDHYYSRFNCKIPFLNGGLFDPIGDYNWVTTDITLPNELFSNTKKTTAGDIGDGILDIFDRYNFTVIEDEPLEKEVAIDPELLGKAYEKFNAIRPDNFDEYLKVLKSGKKGEETKFNKQYGVYYTPREIVHYMCRESLINHLASEFADKSEAYRKIDLEQLDAFGNTTRKGQLPLEAEYKSDPYIPKADIETLINYGELLGENEAVVEAKGIETDTYYYKLPKSIRNNAKEIDEKLANVLICDPAVGSGAFPVGMMHEIVSTRNLLSLFIKDGSRSIYKFKRDCIENSLYGVDIDAGAVEIAKLRLWLSLVVDEGDINNIKPLPNLDYKIVKGNSLIGFPEKWQSDISKSIESLKLDFLRETRPQNKRAIKLEIDNQINSRLKKSKINFGHQIDFDFKTFFSEVYHKQGGFDIAIANPPYVLGRQTISKELKKYLAGNYESYGGKFDLYIYFTEKALQLLKHKGIMFLIVPNTLLANENATKLRKQLLYKNSISILKIFDKLVFEEAQVENIIIAVIKVAQEDNIISIDNGSEIQRINQEEFVKNKDYRFNINSDSTSTILLQKIMSQSQSLGSLSDICIGIQLGGSQGNNKKQDFLSNVKLDQTYKPVLDGRDINYFTLEWKGIYIKYGEWLHRKRNEKYFLNTKIMIRQIGSVPVATYDEEGFYTLNTIYNLISTSKYSLKYFLSIINSNLGKWFWKNVNSDFKTLFPKIKKDQIASVPIKIINPEIENEKRIYENLIELVSKLLLIKNENNMYNDLQDKMNLVIYRLYGLSYEEVKIIDPEIEKIISKKEYEKFEIK